MKKICLTCKKKYKTYNKNRKYCSVYCYANNSNYKNPGKGKKRPDLSLRNKKESSERVKKWFKNPKNKEKIKQRNKNISNSNKKNRQLHSYPGEKNGMWKGGISNGEYGLEFNKELKLAIKIRDDYKCKICKLKEEKTLQGLYI